MSGYKTHLIKEFRVVNNSVRNVLCHLDFNHPITELRGEVKVIKSLTIVIEQNSGFIVPSILDYLVSRALSNKKDSSFEARALRLYFDFLRTNELSWDVSFLQPYKRPLNRFSVWLKDAYESGNIAGTTAVGYFNAVCRYYKYHISNNHPFKGGVPVEFNSYKIKKYGADLTSHISGREIVLDVAKCRPNIRAKDKVTELLPLSVDEQEMFFKQLSKYSSEEFSLICYVSICTGLRASEVADLKLDMFRNFDNESDSYVLKVGPPAGHKTKHNNPMPVHISKSLVELIKRYTISSRYLKRLDKYQGERSPIFITQRGGVYTQKTISTLFNEFVHSYIYPNFPRFNHDFHDFHDFRVTFGVNNMKAALDAGYSHSYAVSYVKGVMRHKNVNDTLNYLEYFEKGVDVELQAEVNENILSEVIKIMDEFK